MGHGHHHGHADAARSFNKAFAIAVALTLTYTLTEAVYGVLANSMSLLADAVHNLGDSLGLILSWIANWMLTLRARKRYSYGFKRTSIFAALTNAFILVATSAMIAFESIRKLFHLMNVDESVIIVVGLVGIVVNLGCSLLFMRGAKDDMNLKSAFLHLMADALILVGVVVSAIVIAYTGWEWIDPVVGLLIVVLVLWGTWGLMRDSLSLMMDAVPRYVDHEGVETYLQSYPGVKAIHDLHIWGLSTREVALTAHLIMPDKMLSDADYKKINHDLHHSFNISHVTLQIESGCDEHPCERREVC